jgi:hypothetical protein
MSTPTRSRTCSGFPRRSSSSSSSTNVRSRVTLIQRSDTLAALLFTPWFKLIAKSFLYKWWDVLLSRSAALSLLEGTHPDAPVDKAVDSPASTADASKAPVKVDASVLREFITDLDRDQILRF